MNQNRVSKSVFIIVAVLTLALFLAINMAGLLTMTESTEIEYQTPPALDWQGRSFDIIILAFFLLGGAIASLRVLPLRKVDPDE